MDYRVRGFTRDVDGVKHFIDHEINSIQDYIPEDIRNRYQMIDVNVLAERIFHTKMRLTEFSLNDYLFAEKAEDLSEAEAAELTDRIEAEVNEIFYGRNFASDGSASTS
jgi:S-adenosylmethionine decarboxylase